MAKADNGTVGEIMPAIIGRCRRRRERENTVIHNIRRVTKVRFAAGSRRAGAKPVCASIPRYLWEVRKWVQLHNIAEIFARGIRLELESSHLTFTEGRLEVHAVMLAVKACVLLYLAIVEQV